MMLVIPMTGATVKTFDCVEKAHLQTTPPSKPVSFSCSYFTHNLAITWTHDRMLPSLAQLKQPDDYPSGARQAPPSYNLRSGDSNGGRCCQHASTVLRVNAVCIRYVRPGPSLKCRLWRMAELFRVGQANVT